MCESRDGFVSHPLTTPFPELIDRCDACLAASEREEIAALVGEAARQPHNPMPLYRLAAMVRRRGQVDLWRDVLATTFAFPHRTHEQLCARADARLTLGDWSGWRDRESRYFNPAFNYFQSVEARTLRWSRKAWDGVEDISNKTLLVVADGGPADFLQMLRFIPWAATHANKILLAVSLEELQLAQQLCGHVATVLFRDMPHTIPYQRYAWLMSMPALCGQLPAFAPLTGIEAARAVPGTEARERRIGLLCDTDRVSTNVLTIESFWTHLEHIDTQWQLLQPASAPLPTQFSVTPLPSSVYSLWDLANLLLGLDCIVCTDGAVAHLAGTLGLPTWLLLRFVADPRWALGETTPWYPSIRILRQPAPDDWHGVVRRLEAELEAFIHDTGSAAMPQRPDLHRDY